METNPIHAKPVGAKIPSWDRLRIFHVVANTGSFAHAGKFLSRHATAIAHQISLLEESLQQRLFYRHQTGLLLTNSGKTLYNDSKVIHDRVHKIEKSFSENKYEPTGLLRVSAPVTFGSVWLAAKVPLFCKQYPKIQVQITLDDQQRKVGYEVDIAIQIRKTEKTGLIEKKIFTTSGHTYASPDYLKQYGEPKTLKDLDDHKIIAFSESAIYPLPEINWLLTEGLPGRQQRPFSCSIDNVYGMIRAAEAGGGVIGLPRFFARGRNLQQILPEIKGPLLPYYLLYPKDLENFTRIQLFRDFLLKEAREIA